MSNAIRYVETAIYPDGNAPHVSTYVCQECYVTLSLEHLEFHTRYDHNESIAMIDFGEPKAADG